MIKPFLLAVALSGALVGTAGAQSAPASSDPIVQARAEEREASGVYASKLLAAWSERHKKINAAVEEATKKAAETGKDPLVAKRDAIAKAEKATKPEYDAALKAATDEYKAKMKAAQKKADAPKK
jgi:hypothetical protein